MKLENKTNVELLQLIAEAAEELKKRTVVNPQSTEDEGEGEDDGDEGGEHPDDPPPNP